MPVRIREMDESGALEGPMLLPIREMSKPSKTPERLASMCAISLEYLETECTSMYPWAMEILRWAVDQGDVNAEFRLGLCYINGVYGTKRDLSAGIFYLERAARRGDMLAQRCLARWYDTVDKGSADAVYWGKKSASH